MTTTSAEILVFLRCLGYLAPGPHIRPPAPGHHKSFNQLNLFLFKVHVEQVLNNEHLQLIRLTTFFKLICGIFK